MQKVAFKTEKVKNLLEKVKGQRKVPKGSYFELGKYKIVDQGEGFINGYTNDESLLYKGPMPVVVFGDHTCRLKFLKHSFCLGADGTQLMFTKKLNQTYFYYALKSLDFKISAYQRHYKLIKEKSILYPENKETQTRIASVLSSYDDLIEKNEKRIKILGEMAQLLYMEWFVKFKFPGYEKVKMVDSGTDYGMIPVGWKVVEMRSVAKIIDCLHTKKPKQIETGRNLFLQLENILDNGMINFSSTYYISDEDYKKWTSNIELREGDCVVTNVGRIAASAQIPNGVIAAAGRNMTVIRPEKIPASFLIQYLHSRHMEKEVSRKTDAGAIMGSLNVKNIYLLKVLIPDNSLLENYSNLVSIWRNEANTLHKDNFILSQTRDLLIPQLVTGKRELK